MSIDRAQVLAQFGAALRAARKSKGLTIKAVCDTSGLNPSYVGGIERGETNVSLENQKRLAAAVGVTLAELMADADL